MLFDGLLNLYTALGKVVAGHVREQVVFELEIERAGEPGVKSGGCDVAGAAHLGFEEVVFFAVFIDVHA